MKKLLRIVGIIVLIVVIIFGVFYAIYNEALPDGRTGPEADALAKKMLTSLNYEAYANTQFLEWSFRGGEHLYKWDKTNATVEVQWDNYVVHIDLIAPDSSKASKDGVLLDSGQSASIIEKAIDMFNNDSFWLVAPYKIMDKGTQRKIITTEEGHEALLVTYMKGGTTPGDSYLWVLQPNGFPKSFKMWVSIIPIGGVQATWDDWAVMQSGAFLPKTHVLGPLELSMGDIKGYNR